MDTWRLCNHSCYLLGDLQGCLNPSHVSNGPFGGSSQEMFMDSFSLALFWGNVLGTEKWQAVFLQTVSAMDMSGISSFGLIDCYFVNP